MERPMPRFALRRLPVARDGLARALMDAVVDWGLYVDGVRVPHVRFDEARIAPEGFLWIGVHSPTLRQLGQLAEIFGPHPLAVEDAANPRRRPKLERGFKRNGWL